MLMIELQGQHLKLCPCNVLQAIFRPPLESLLVNGELMEAIGIYSLAMVMKAQRFFKSLDSLKSFF